jgi:hypothetical protein
MIGERAIVERAIVERAIVERAIVERAMLFGTNITLVGVTFMVAFRETL